MSGAGKTIVFRNIEHLVRLAVVMALALIVFIIFRAAIVPKSFGQYGHYRGAAISEVASRSIRIAGRDTCEGCHTDVADQKKLGRHVVLSCEACHGAQGKHAEDPANVRPPKLDTTVCARCHEANSAKPKTFPQVVMADHAGGIACDTCHQPHKPKIENAPSESANTKVSKKTEAKK